MLIICAVVLFLAIFGGLQCYLSPAGYVFVVAAPAVTFLGLGLLALFIATMVVVHHEASRQEVWCGLYLAAILWPVVLVIAWLAGWHDNRNIIAAWSVLFVAVALHGRRWAVLVVHLVLLLILGSRGAILGAGVVVAVTVYLVIKQPGIPANINTKSIYGLAALALVSGLALWRVDTMLVRLHYWQSAWDAFLAYPVLGAGPEGIRARELITEPGGAYQIHAHNLIATTGAELGLVGLAGLAATVWLSVRARWNIDHWQVAALAGLLAHSLVDEPLWWPGPLLGLAIVLGTIKKK
jgi:hypothetical protein